MIYNQIIDKQQKVSKKKKYVRIRDCATICLLGIFMGQSLPIPVVIWRGIFVVLCWYSIYLRRGQLTRIETCLNGLAILCSVYFLIHLLWDGYSSITLVGAIIFTMPACSLFFLLHSKGVITKKWININCILFLIAAIVNYIFFMRKVMLARDIEEFENMTNNASTIFLSLIPFILLSSKRCIQWGGLLVCWYFLLLAVKRGNILGAIMPTFCFLLSFKSEIRRSPWKIVSISFLVLVSGYVIADWISQNGYLNVKMTKALDGDYSDRDVIYMYFIEYWLNSNIFYVIFGHGFHATAELSTFHLPAHNDWIESLFDYGIIGFLFELSIFLSFISLARKRSKYRLVLLSVFFIWLEKSMFSMGYMDPLNVFVYMSLGIVLSEMAIE
jgi:hypothetical protein